MKAFLALALALTVGAQAIAQESGSSPTTDTKMLERIRKSLENHVHSDIAVTWNGEEVTIARSDVEVHYGIGKRFEVFVRVNFLPYLGKQTIVDKLNANEDIRGAVTAAITQSVRNQIAAKLGIPASYVVVPAPVLKAALDANLDSAVKTFVDSKITSDAQLDAAVRELGFAVSLIGDSESNNQVVLEVGKIDAMTEKDTGYFNNYFRLSRPAVRLKYQNESAGLVVYVEAANDPGLWEIANPEANASAAFVATIIARKTGKFFDLSNVNAWEVGVIKSGLAIAVGTRPVLDRGVDSKYVLTAYEVNLGGYVVTAQGSLEGFEDPVYGSTLVKRFEGGVMKTFKGYEISGKAYSRYDSFLRKDFATIQTGLTKALWNTKLGTIGVGARAYMYKYHGVDDNGDNYTWQKGGDVGIGVRFGQKPVSAQDVLFKSNQELNAQRLKDQTKSVKK